MTIESDRDYSIECDSFVVKASFGADPDLLVRNLDLALSSPAMRNVKVPIEYIDLRFGNRIYFKPTTAKTPEAKPLATSTNAVDIQH